MLWRGKVETGRNLSEQPFSTGSGRITLTIFYSRIIRRMMCESMLSTNAEIAPITVAVVNQAALRALRFFSNRLAPNMQVRPWSLVSVLAPVMMNW